MKGAFAKHNRPCRAFLNRRLICVPQYVVVCSRILGFCANDAGMMTVRRGAANQGSGGTAYLWKMKPERSLNRSLSKWLFPGDAPWQRRKKIKSLLLAACIGILLGGLAILIAWSQAVTK
jgi:hypothetical protein